VTVAGRHRGRGDDGRNGGIAGGQPHRRTRKFLERLPVPVPRSRERLVADNLAVSDQLSEQDAVPGPRPAAA
jgi:hypothetical protein